MTTFEQKVKALRQQHEALLTRRNELVTTADGKTVPAMTTAEGSLIVTLNSAYLKTLSYGQHTLTVTFSSGQSVSAMFTIAAPSNVPSTGETVSPALSTGIVLISTAILVAGACTVTGKKKKQD